MIRQAIIPLAGQGTRLLPLTSVFPKELLPINGKPGIEYIIDECIEISEKLSLVNVFRIFFNEYFDTNYEILEDRHIWHHEEPFINEDVTNRLNSFIIK